MSADLIERLEKAGGADRELDAAIARHLAEEPEEFCFYFLDAWTTDATAPAFTSSLDAALALAEWVLPECDVWVGRLNGEWEADCEPKGCERHARFVDHRGNTPALALCTAILKALAATPNTEEKADA